uniref:Uncharacterized protein n=1 Tax=viral metagenome TaxID=1070528 RepID=A0A6M3KMG6_9ZZZZ
MKQELWLQCPIDLPMYICRSTIISSGAKLCWASLSSIAEREQYFKKNSDLDEYTLPIAEVAEDIGLSTQSTIPLIEELEQKGMIRTEILDDGTTKFWFRSHTIHEK